MKAVLEELLEGERFEVSVESWGHLYSLPTPEGADYSLECSLHMDGEPQVSAFRVGGYGGEYFWYKPFEINGYGSEAARIEAFRGVVAALVRNPSRIVQRKGLLFWRFTASAETPGGAIEIPGASCFRPAFRVPPTDGRTRCYSSPAIAAGQRGTSVRAPWGRDV